jgi:hypothetical protein
MPDETLYCSKNVNPTPRKTMSGVRSRCPVAHGFVVAVVVVPAPDAVLLASSQGCP